MPGGKPPLIFFFLFLCSPNAPTLFTCSRHAGQSISWGSNCTGEEEVEEDWPCWEGPGDGEERFWGTVAVVAVVVVVGVVA